MPRPIYATIDLPALVHNYWKAKQKVSPAKVFAVLKNNAYGHGINAVGLALRDYADAFAVLDLKEAITLRDLGCTQDILLLGGLFEPVDLWIAHQYRLSFTVTTFDQLLMLESQASFLLQNLLEPLFCTVKVRSPMNRLGVAFNEAVQVWQRLEALPNIYPNGWMTHFANADQSSPDHIELEQTLTKMKALQRKCPAPLCTANSSAILQHPSTHADAVRAGILLYGSSPIADYDVDYWELRPVLTLTSHIIAIHTIMKGEAVGYGHRFVADGPRCIAVVACGYGDGYPRHACDGTPVWINGKTYPLVGCVSMDSLTVDVSNAQQLTIGTPVELWGKNLSIDRVAKYSKTISYQIFCNLATRVPRIFNH